MTGRASAWAIAALEENGEGGNPAAAMGFTGVSPAADVVNPKEKAALEFEDGMGCGCQTPQLMTKCWCGSPYRRTSVG